jgi:hypothetical protein
MPCLKLTERALADMRSPARKYFLSNSGVMCASFPASARPCTR